MHGLIFLQLVLDIALPFIYENQAPVSNIAFSFCIASTSRVKGFGSEEICELLEHECTSEFSNFTESENSDNKVDNHSTVDSFCKKKKKIMTQ